MRIISISFFFVFVANFIFAQEQINEAFAQNQLSGDSLRSVKDVFQSSEWHFHSRSFFMGTMNQGQLKDDYALAQGAGIGLLTKSIKGFQLGMSGYFIFNVLSSNLAEKDPTTQGLNRYEIGQFDVLNRTNTSSFDRLEELFLRYHFRQSTFTLGRMSLETPFVNMQDGRMRPTLEEGIWIDSKGDRDKWRIQGGVLWGIFPRSTSKWMTLKESIGIYGIGSNALTGKPQLVIADKINGVFMLNVDCQWNESNQLRYWNVWVDQLMSTNMLEWKMTQPVLKGQGYFNTMLIQQNSLSNGGNANQQLTYFTKGSQSNVISAQVGWKKKMLNFNLNYTHIFNGDRYLMPREWGRDPFYTFMSRERNEGLANVHAFTTQLTRTQETGLKWGGGLGYYRLPSITNFAQNKYGMPSYGQVNLFASYGFKGVWEGLEIRFLIAGKTEMSKEIIPLKNQINKVNMINSNVVIDFHL
jgi:hypothetical protein